MAATDLRVHLGEALRSLEEGDIVIEKGGVPVAVLTRYRDAAARADAVSEPAAYDRALSKRGDRRPEALAAALEAMDTGWAGLDADATIEAIYRGREEGAWYRFVDEERVRTVADAPPPGQRHLYRPSAKNRRPKA